MAPVSSKRVYVKEIRKKPRGDRTAFWVTLFLLIGAFAAGWWLWTCLYQVTPEFNYLSLNKNGAPLKVLNGETLHIHPRDKISIAKVSTNICFNYGVRLTAEGFDVNAFLYDGMTFAELLADRDIYERHEFRVRVKRYNQEMGFVDILVEPHLEDWLRKAKNAEDGNQKVEILERTLKMAPGDSRIKDRLIEAYKALNQWSKAAVMLEEVAEKRPNRKVLYDLIEVYESMSDTGGVISTLKRLVAEDPEDLELRLRLASVLEKAGQLEEAIAEYEKILPNMADEDKLATHKVLGYLYTETERPEDAISHYRRALEYDDRDVNLYYNLSVLYERTGQKDSADDYLAKAVAFRPEDLEGRLKLAQRSMDRGHMDEARKYLQEVLDQNPESLDALLLMAGVAEAQEDKQALIEVYRRIEGLDPENETILYNLGVLEYETGNLEGSLPYFIRFAALHPDDAEVHGFLFDIYRKQQKNELAFEEARTLTRLKPDDIGPYHYIFEYLNAEGQYEEIGAAMTEGLKAHPENPDLRKYLTVAYLKTGKEDLAIKEMRKLLEAKPQDPTLMLQLARLEEKQGELRAALKHYKGVIELSPGHEEAEEAYLRLRLMVLPGENEEE